MDFSSFLQPFVYHENVKKKVRFVYFVPKNTVLCTRDNRRTKRKTKKHHEKEEEEDKLQFTLHIQYRRHMIFEKNIMILLLALVLHTEKKKKHEIPFSSFFFFLSFILNESRKYFIFYQSLFIQFHRHSSFWIFQQSVKYNVFQ